jgi:hypothetical protein
MKGVRLDLFELHDEGLIMEHFLLSPIHFFLHVLYSNESSLVGTHSQDVGKDGKK